MTLPALEVRNLTKRYGGLVATHDLSLSIARGARHALIGPNGAGKTTLVNLLSGALKPSAGQILLEGKDITRLPAHRRAQQGLLRTFQINQLFATLTPWESLLLVLTQRDGKGGHWWQGYQASAAHAHEARELLTRLQLADVKHTPTPQLPYGKRRLLEIAVALAGRPRVLLLDEPMAGVPRAQAHDILNTLLQLPDHVTVVLIEHDMDLVFRYATAISVLVNGALYAHGTPAQISLHPGVREVYLGAAHA